MHASWEIKGTTLFPTTAHRVLFYVPLHIITVIQSFTVTGVVRFGPNPPPLSLAW